MPCCIWDPRCEPGSCRESQRRRKSGKGPRQLAREGVAKPGFRPSLSCGFQTLDVTDQEKKMLGTSTFYQNL